MTGASLSERFVARVERGDVDGLAELYTDDALFDAHVPNWRFQVAGRDAIRSMLWGLRLIPHHMDVGAFSQGS